MSASETTRSVEKVAPEYVFTFDVIASDREGYYYDNWGRSNRYEVIGATIADAHKALLALLGDAPRGRFWKANQRGSAVDVRLRTQPEGNQS